MSALFDRLGIRTKIVDGETYVNASDFGMHLHMTAKSVIESLAGETLSIPQRYGAASVVGTVQGIIELLQDGIVDSQFERLTSEL